MSKQSGSMIGEPFGGVSEELLEFRRIRAEQDQEYQESLRIDQEKV